MEAKKKEVNDEKSSVEVEPDWAKLTNDSDEEMIGTYKTLMEQRLYRELLKHSMEFVPLDKEETPVYSVELTVLSGKGIVKFQVFDAPEYMERVIKLLKADRAIAKMLSLKKSA